MKNAFCTPKAINFDFLEAPWPTKDLFWNVQEAFEDAQDGFRTLQKRFKTLPSTYWTSLLCVWVAFCFQMFPQSIFEQCMKQNHHFCVFKDWFRLVFWSPIGLPGPSKGASKPLGTPQNFFKHLQDITSVGILQSATFKS